MSSTSYDELWQTAWGDIQRHGPVHRHATEDLTYWRAAVVVLVPGSRNGDLLEATLTDLLGQPPQQVGGVKLWDVRDLPVPPAG